MKHITSLSSIIDAYDSLILDLWGVVHDGTHLYPGVLEVLEQLKAANKKVMFLSNAPRRSHKVVAVLEKMGVSDALYSEAMSSGEMGCRWLEQLQNNRDEKRARSVDRASLQPASCENQEIFAEAKNYYYIGPDKDTDVIDHLDYERVDELSRADFVLNVGFGSEAQATDDIRPVLEEAQSLSLPMLCLNPDLEVVKQTGERFGCAGELAHIYEELGGEVKWFGKPYKEVYDYCLNALATPKDKILAIGDSLYTDIKGANNAGIECVLVTGGILKNQAHKLDELCIQHAAAPTYVIPEMVW